MYVSKLLLTLLSMKFEAIGFSLDILNCNTYVNIYVIGRENLNKYV